MWMVQTSVTLVTWWRGENFNKTHWYAWLVDSHLPRKNHISICARAWRVGMVGLRRESWSRGGLGGRYKVEGEEVVS